MDPLTHTLVGANLGATRLGEKTRLATAACVIGANLPDVDAILYFTGHRDLALGFRRGWTHGALAMVVLPVVLTALLLAYAKLRPDRERRTSGAWLLALSFLAVLTHPALDWLNNYGMRWLMPFRGTWFYGDSVYIMDPWLWLILGGGWLAARRPTWPTIAAGAIVVVLLARVIARRDPRYLIVLVIVAAVMLVALLWKSKRSLSTVALIAAACYIGARLTIHYITALEVRRALGSPQRLMVAPYPIDPTRWDVVAQLGDHYRFGHFTWGRGGLTLAPERIDVARPSREWEAARRDPSIQGFLTWARFPAYAVEETPSETRVRIFDVRYAPRRGASGLGGAVIVIKD